MTVMMTAATMVDAARDGTSADNASAGNCARSEDAIAAGCNGHAATSKAATAADRRATATASKATATADSCAATPAGPDTAATTASDAVLRLSGAEAWHDHRQHKRNRRRCTQNFQIDHCRLHLRDIGPNPFSGRTFPSPRFDCAQAEPVRSELYAE
jgi:hypothetical protein